LAGWKFVEFDNTVVMSTYLVAFSVNLFSDNGEIIGADNIKYNVWARPNAVSTGKYANNNAPKVVEFMTGFTGIKYPLPKIDQIAVPDFAAGAMENWGLITYR
jgi:aminopeptidase N